jgi:hypothetical protein
MHSIEDQLIFLLSIAIVEKSNLSFEMSTRLSTNLSVISMFYSTLIFKGIKRKHVYRDDVEKVQCRVANTYIDT